MAMELIFSPPDELVSAALGQANSPEHNLCLYNAQQWERVLARFSDGSSILALTNQRQFRVFGDALSPQFERFSVHFDFAHHLLAKGLATKVTLPTVARERWLELEEHTEFFRVSAAHHATHYAVFSFDTWNGDFESVRKMHRALEEKQYHAYAASYFSAEQLKKLVLAQHTKHYAEKFAMIDIGFAGAQARVLAIDEHPVSLCCHWEVAGEDILGWYAGPNEVLLDLLLTLRQQGRRRLLIPCKNMHELDVVNKLHPSSVRIVDEITLLPK